jgi:hypothetical protein
MDRVRARNVLDIHTTRDMVKLEKYKNVETLPEKYTNANMAHSCAYNTRQCRSGLDSRSVIL